MRHDTAIMPKDTEKLQINMEKENGNDIRRHVHNTLRLHRNFADTSSLVTAICNRASKNFLWATLAVRQVHSALEKGDDYATIMSLIQQIPKETE